MKLGRDRITAPFEAAAPTDRYVTVVDAGRLDVERMTANLNRIAAMRWRLHTAFEQAGNTVLIFERD
jgi:hypothetical protein